MNRWIAWFARNGVAANLLMAFVLLYGGLSLTRIVREVFPAFDTRTISILVPYLGAAPEEVEQGVCIKVEEAIQDLVGIRKLRSNASEGAGTVLVELEADADSRRVLEEIKSRVDAITTFPEETEKAIIQEFIVRRKVITLALSGEVPELTLKRLGEQVRDRLGELPDITQVDLGAVRPYEISIEVSEERLRRWGLTFDEVARAVQRSSLDMPGGSIKSDAGEILLLTKGQAYHARAFEQLVLRARRAVTRLVLGDVAAVIDGFADTDVAARFDGKPAVLVQIYRVGNQSALRIADQVKAFVAELEPTLPPGVTTTTWQDDTQVLRDRLDLLLRNGRMSLILVFLSLALFIKLRLAAWVTSGIAVAFMGAFVVMPWFGVSINVMSLFAFVMVLGIVVDDAIVVSENIYRHWELGKTGLRAAIDGTREVAMPVIFSVLTTMAAFYPLISIPGPPGQIMRVIPIIVISCLAFSLLESMFVLPNHLSHISERERDPANQSRVSRLWYRFQGIFTGGLDRFIQGVYRPLLERALAWRYVSLAVAAAVLLVTVGLVGGGFVRFIFCPEVEGDNAVAALTMPLGTPSETTAAVVRRIEESAFALERELKQEGRGQVFRHVMATIGEHPYAVAQRQVGPSMGRADVGSSAGHLGEVNIELVPSQERRITSQEVANRWRALVGEVPDAVELDFTSSLMRFGNPIDIQLSAESIDDLRAAGAELKDALRQYPGAFDVADSYRAGKRELKLDLLPRGEALGLTLMDLARQVRSGFYGTEAQRIQRGRDDVRVMVRYTEAERGSLASLERMRIRAPDGSEVPFAYAGAVSLGAGYSSIQCTDRQRTMNVSADVYSAVANANELVRDLRAQVLPQLLAQHPGVRYSMAGEQEEQTRAMGAMLSAFLVAQVLIYVLLAIPLRSYAQPLIVMSAIPFGLVGALGGHFLFGLDLSLLSIFGIVALTGVVVNDSLVMVDFINGHRKRDTLDRAIRDAGVVRFRPVMLTTLTTFMGLVPLILERSLQAQFLIPMAISLGFGVAFATAITLLLVPVLYRTLEDFRRQRPAASPELETGELGRVAAG